MPNGFLFELSRLFGLTGYTSGGKRDRRLVFWSLVCCTFWASVNSLAALSTLMNVHTDTQKKRFLNLSMVIFQFCVHEGGRVFLVLSNTLERYKAEPVLRAVTDVEPSSYDGICVIVGLGLTLLILSSFPSTPNKNWWTTLSQFGSSYTLCTEVLAVLQMCSLLKRLSAKFKELKRNIRSHRRIDYLGHSALIALAQDANKLFEIQLFLSSFNAFTVTIFSSYNFYEYLIRLKGFHVTFVCLVLIVSRALLLLLWLCVACEEIHADADSFNVELSDVLRENEELCHDNALYVYVVVRNTVKISACGFFYVGYPLVTSIISAALSYLAILIQFS